MHSNWIYLALPYGLCDPLQFIAGLPDGLLQHTGRPSCFSTVRNWVLDFYSPALTHL